VRVRGLKIRKRIEVAGGGTPKPDQGFQGSQMKRKGNDEQSGGHGKYEGDHNGGQRKATSNKSRVLNSPLPLLEERGGKGGGIGGRESLRKTLS